MFVREFESTHIVLPSLAPPTTSAGHARLQAHPVADLKCSYCVAYRCHDAARLVAQHHRSLHDIVPNGAIKPEVEITAADSGEFNVYEDIVWRLQGRNRPVFEFERICFFEDEGKIL